MTRELSGIEKHEAELEAMRRSRIMARIVQLEFELSTLRHQIDPFGAYQCQTLMGSLGAQQAIMPSSLLGALLGGCPR